MYNYEKYERDEERKIIYNKKVFKFKYINSIYSLLIPLKIGEEIIIFYLIKK